MVWAIYTPSEQCSKVDKTFLEVSKKKIYLMNFHENFANMAQCIRHMSCIPSGHSNSGNHLAILHGIEPVIGLTRAILYCSSLCHYYNFIITPLLRHYYIIIMSLLPIRNDEYSIILCYAKGKLLLLYNYYQLLHHYYKHSYVYQLLHIFVSQTCRCLTQSELVLYFQNQQKILKK